MTTYAIGDIQGCYDPFRRLLDKLEFDPGSDQLWLVGDLVNRGPDSLGVLRYVRGLGEAAVTVLGNHDLHLLALGAGNDKTAAMSSLHDVLMAPDREELLHWLRHRPLMHYDASKDFAMVHAGLAPQWDLLQALSCAREVEDALQGPEYRGFLHAMYGNQPAKWSPTLKGMDRLRFITNCMTRMRYCLPDGTLGLKEKGPVGTQTKPYIPWFEIPWRASSDFRLVIGHWSTLGYMAKNNVWALDTGCLWGFSLTAIPIRKKKDIEPISLDCPTGALRD
jgi:bis(5'-nucleosyl)-tetraphosphatase (symmetrical)